MTKRLFIPIIMAMMISFFACSEDDSSAGYSYNDPTIYSSSNKTLFSEVIFFLKPYVEENDIRKYIVTDTLFNISLKINNQYSYLSYSLPMDTLHIEGKESSGNFRTTSTDIHYPVIMNVDVKPESFNTAGQYANLLNNYFTLSPGVYVCQIISFDIKTSSGITTTVYTPSLSFPLEVKENTTSSNLGEFAIPVKQ